MFPAARMGDIALTEDDLLTLNFRGNQEVTFNPSFDHVSVWDGCVDGWVDGWMDGCVV